MSEVSQPRTWRRRVHAILDGGIGGDPVATAVNVGLIVLICLNVLAFVVDSVPWVRATYGNYFIAFEIFSVAVFTIEYVLRLWACVELPFLSHMPPWRARSQFASRPMQVVDLLAFLPAYVEPFLPIDLSFLRILRLFRFLKIARYSAALQSLGRVIAAERGRCSVRSSSWCACCCWLPRGCISSRGACSRSISARSPTVSGGRSSR